jgi:hypothetical protein
VGQGEDVVKLNVVAEALRPRLLSEWNQPHERRICRVMPGERSSFRRSDRVIFTGWLDLEIRVDDPAVS